MTNPYAAIPLSYDGEDLQHADFGLFLQITQGLSETPEVRGRDVTVPALTGQLPRNRKAHERPLVLTGLMIGNGSTEAIRRADYRTTWRYLNELFDPTRMPADLVAILEDGDTATISARPRNIIPNELIVSEAAIISVELFSIAPNWTIA